MQTKYSINQAQLTHVEALAELFDAYRVFYKKDTDIESAKRFLQERIQNAESVIFIASEESGRQVGFTQLYPLFSSTRMQRLWLLNDLFVLPEMRGKGISHLLIDHAKQHCEQTQACGLILETAKDNAVGNQLYPKAGFELDTAYQHYFWDNIKV